MSIGYQSRIRGSFARVVYNKLLEDQEEAYCNHNHWYTIKLENISANYRNKFIQFSEDSSTKDFLQQSTDKSNWIFKEILHIIIKYILSWFMTSTSINGLLNRGSMFVMSPSQFGVLLDIYSAQKFNRMLDLGAGDGAITSVMAQHFQSVDSTELSQTMRWQLAKKKFNVVDVDEWFLVKNGHYDLISCLNLLDRCSYPMDILLQAHSILKPGEGKLLLALVLPFKPFVEMNSTSHKPKQRLDIRGSSFEEDFNDLMDNVLTPIGFDLLHFSRLPYLCEGDLHHSYYVLSDAVLVLTPKTQVVINEPKKTNNF